MLSARLSAIFRLIVSGGCEEIERLIKKVDLDKEILAEQNNGEEEPDSRRTDGAIT